MADIATEIDKTLIIFNKNPDSSYTYPLQFDKRPQESRLHGLPGLLKKSYKDQQSIGQQKPHMTWTFETLTIVPQSL